MNSLIAQRIDGLALLCAVAIALGGAAGCGGKSLQDDGGAGAGGASLGGRGAGGSGSGGNGGIAGGAGGAAGAGGQSGAGGRGGAGGSVGGGGSGGMSGTTGGAGNGGISGTTGGAGNGGMSGTTGAAGSGGFPPGCLRDLFAPCSIAGSCAYQADDAGNPVSFCYASGARLTSTGLTCTTIGPSGATATITKPDGTLCYTVSNSADPWQACENVTYRWSDASGATVATGTTGPGGSISIRCEVGGETAMRSGTQPYLIFTSGECSPGNCP